MRFGCRVGVVTISWNVRRANEQRPAWGYLLELEPDLALLQEVGAIPPAVRAEFCCILRRATGRPRRPQRFATAILAKGEVHEPIQFATEWDWVDRELRLFAGNLVAHRITLQGVELHVMSVHSPAWPIPPDRLAGIDVSPIKLQHNPRVWVTELLYAALRSVREIDRPPWIIGGDLNSSETFDDLWPGGPHGNREVQERMRALGFVEALRHANGRLIPTFRDPRAGRIVHQIDHLFISPSLVSRLDSCVCGDHERVLTGSLSDHLPIIAEIRMSDWTVA